MAQEDGDIVKVIVCGGRRWKYLKSKLDELNAAHQFTELLHGAAPGADTLASSWASISGVPQRPFIARWATEGKAAGPNRNARMLADGHIGMVIAFPGGRGTADMIQQAKAKGVLVIEW